MESMRNTENPLQHESENESDNQPKDKPILTTEHVNPPTPPGAEHSLGNTKEKALDTSEYEALKIKEHLGQLSQEEFDRLLAFDFQEQLKETPPIEGVFFPEEELMKIKVLPREQKREALAIFKEKLARQREALAACRVHIERSITFNHNVPREKLLALTEQFYQHYGFNERQRQIIERLIDTYYENRRNVLEIRRKFPDDRELVTVLTRVNIDKNETLIVSVGPMTIDIGTDGFNTERLYKELGGKSLSSQLGGFAAKSVGKKPVFLTVINHDPRVRAILHDPIGEKTKEHEHEHQKNNLFKEIFEQQELPGFFLPAHMEKQDPEIKKVILENFFIARRTVALNRVKDEITACSLSKPIQTLRFQLHRLFFEQEGGHLDYLAYVRNWAASKDDTIYREIAQKILVQEYQTIVENAISAFVELVNKGKYSTQEATALLTDVPLEKWPKTIRRFLEYRMRKQDPDAE